jgi:hypothetical protein
VENYFGRQCSFANCLPALTGFVDLFSKTELDGLYFAGLWQKKIISQLGWAAFGNAEIYDPEHTRISSRLSCLSWASIPGLISFRIPLDSEEDAKLKVHELHLLEPNGPFDRVDRVQFILEGHLIPWASFQTDEVFSKSINWILAVCMRLTLNMCPLMLLHCILGSLNPGMNLTKCTSSAFWFSSLFDNEY